MSLKGKIFYVFLTSIFSIIIINKKAYFLLIVFLLFMIFVLKKFSLKYCGVLVLVFSLKFCFAYISPLVKDMLQNNIYDFFKIGVNTNA